MIIMTIRWLAVLRLMLLGDVIMKTIMMMLFQWDICIFQWDICIFSMKHLYFYSGTFSFSLFAFFQWSICIFQWNICIFFSGTFAFFQWNICMGLSSHGWGVPVSGGCSTSCVFSCKPLYIPAYMFQIFVILREFVRKLYLSHFSGWSRVSGNSGPYKRSGETEFLVWMTNSNHFYLRYW